MSSRRENAPRGGKTSFRNGSTPRYANAPSWSARAALCAAMMMISRAEELELAQTDFQFHIAIGGED